MPLEPPVSSLISVSQAPLQFRYNVVPFSSLFWIVLVNFLKCLSCAFHEGPRMLPHMGIEVSSQPTPPSPAETRVDIYGGPLSAGTLHRGLDLYGCFNLYNCPL